MERYKIFYYLVFWFFLVLCSDSLFLFLGNKSKLNQVVAGVNNRSLKLERRKIKYEERKGIENKEKEDEEEMLLHRGISIQAPFGSGTH